MARATVSDTSATGKVKPPETQSRMKRFAPHLPYEEFPLFPLIDKRTGTGRWAKKAKKSLHYYGSIADGWEAALQAYERYFPFDSTGRARPIDTATGGLTISRLCDHYYEAKRRRHEAGELALSSLVDYDQTCKTIASAFNKHRLVTDLDSVDFSAFRASLAKRLGPVALGNEINRTRMVFNFAFKNGLIDRPIRFGSEFARPSKKVLRLHRAEKGPKTLAADQIRKLIDNAGVPLEAMILLGINCGLGNKDISDLNQSHLDFDGGWLTFPRQKTGVARRCPLWPQTIKAIRQALAERPEPVEPADADAVFLTSITRQRWVRGTTNDAVGGEFNKLLNTHGMKREGIGFYVLRHVHRTVSDEAKDQRAAGVIMGHEDGHISTAYVERVSDERLQAVADHVRAWLFPKPAQRKGKSAKPTRKRKPKERRPPLRTAG